MDKSSIFGHDTAFARFMNAFGDMIAVGLLWFVTSLPLVTMGAASCAAYQTTIKIVRGKSTGVFAMYFEVFKENLKITLLINLMGLLFFGWLAFDVIYLYGYGTQFSVTLSIILYVVIGLYIAFISYLYPLISRFDEKIFELFKIAIFLTFKHIFSSVLLVIIPAVCIYLLYLFPWSIFIVPGLYWYLMSFPVKRVLSILASDKEEEYDLETSEELDEEKINEEEIEEKPRKRKKQKRKERNIGPEDVDGYLEDDDDNQIDDQMEDKIIRKE